MFISYDENNDCKMSSVLIRKPWINYQNIYPKPFTIDEDNTEEELINKIEESKKSINEAEIELNQSLNLQELKDRVIQENIINSKRIKLNDLKVLSLEFSQETDIQKNDRTTEERNLLNLAKEKLNEIIKEHDSIKIPNNTSDNSEFSRKKININVENIPELKLRKTKLFNMIGTFEQDVRIAEKNLNNALNITNKYKKEINDLSLEINQLTQKYNESNYILKNINVIETKINLFKKYLNKNIENYEKFKLQGVSIISKSKTEEYDSNGNLNRVINNASEMYHKLNKLDEDPPITKQGDNFMAQMEYDFLSNYLMEMNSVYNYYKTSEYSGSKNIDKSLIDWQNNCYNEIKDIRNRIKELNIILKNQNFWTVTDQEKYNNQKKEIYNKHIIYINEDKIQECFDDETNFNKTTDITMEEYLKSIKKEVK